ncbi:MAG: DNA-binding transcriptional regulator [Sedimentisphaerales bacterium]|nr:DNA-binding transcriptional regulator [Sedimentisphaerales bacterium]
MRKVIIMVDTARASGRKFLKGIERYIRSNTSWQVCVQPPHYLPTSKFNAPSWFKLQEADGLIARDSQHTASILKLKIPRIINDTKLENPAVSSIYTNSEKTSELAAKYFIGLGFKNYAFCGFEGLAWSDKRKEKFTEHLQKKGFENIFNYRDSLNKTQKSKTERQSIAQWLKSLPTPACVFACNDDRAIHVLEACKISNIAVPEEIAVLGVDNDDLICDLSSPPLSSIELNFEKGGFEAAGLMDKMISGDKTSTNIVIEPLDIVTRQSTDIFAIEDKQLVKALIFIRENYEKPIQVKDVVASTELSRRRLELLFKKYIKKSIKDEITLQRTESIKRRLRNSTEPLYMIAKSLKYTDPEHFSRFFKNATGFSPTAYRAGTY